MGKKLRPKQKSRRSRSRRHISRQNFDGQIIIRDCESNIITEDCEAQIITQDCESEFITENCEGDIIRQGCEGEIIRQGCEGEIIRQGCEGEIIRQGCEGEGRINRHSFDCLNEDGILCSILSQLPLKEVVRTCVLSRRWRHSWIYLPILNFDHYSILDDETLEHYKRFRTGKDKFFLLLGKTDQFIQNVHSILQQHSCHVRVEEFLIKYFLFKPHSHHLDAWVSFVVASKTKKLSLYLQQPHSKFSVELYDFPFHLLQSSSIEELYLAFCTLKPPNQFDGLNHLKNLYVWGVSATGEDINRLLSNCSSLQRFGVMISKELVILNIPHSLSQLDRLVIIECDNLTKIEINARNLNYMGYDGAPVDFVLRQPSCLKEARIYFKTKGNDNLNFYLIKLAKELPHLQFLALHISDVSEVANLPQCSASFIHLKRLNWDCPKWSVGVKMNLPHLDMLLDAAPFLEELKLRLSTCGVEEAPPRVTKLKKKLPVHPRSRPHLKSIEISGFHFETWQVQIVLYLLKSAIGLESMTLDEAQEISEPGQLPVKEISEKGQKPVKEIRETDMKSLIQQVPPNVKLIIL